MLLKKNLRTSRLSARQQVFNPQDPFKNWEDTVGIEIQHH
jgi:hypothetical protein